MIPKPLGNFVLIRAKKVDNVSGGGIILQEDMVGKEQAVEQTGEVVAFGPIAFKRWKGCESPRWLDKAFDHAAGIVMEVESFEALCDYWKWEDDEFPAHKQWGIKIGDTVEHRKYNAMDSVTSGDTIYRYIPDIEILGVIDDE